MERSYETWMFEVDQCLVRKMGVSSADLPDICYHDLYDEGVSPEEAADIALDNAMN